jgi:hypothetical protein
MHLQNVMATVSADASFLLDDLSSEIMSEILLPNVDVPEIPFIFRDLWHNFIAMAVEGLMPTSSFAMSLSMASC